MREVLLESHQLLPRRIFFNKEVSPGNYLQTDEELNSTSQRRSDKRAVFKTFLSCDQYKTCGFRCS